MNEDKYSSAKEIIKGLNIWINDKHLLESIVSRAERLEKEVLSKQKALDERDREVEDLKSMNAAINEDFENLNERLCESSLRNIKLKEQIAEHDREVKKLKQLIRIQRGSSMMEENQRLRQALEKIKWTQWIDGVAPDLGDEDVVWVIAEIPSLFRKGIYSYKTFVWHMDGGWHDNAILRARRWMLMPMPPSFEGVEPE